MATGKIMEVDGADIRARSSMQGTRQRIFVGDAQMKVKVAVFKLGTSADDRLRGLNLLSFVFGGMIMLYLELPVVRNYRSKLKQHFFLLFGIFLALFQK